MKLRLVPGSVATLCALLAGSPAASPADSAFRCATGRVASTGDHMYEVRQKCGEPDAATQRTVTRRVREKVWRWVAGVAHQVSEEREVEILLDEWIYDLGSDRFVRYVTFENGRLVGVSTGGRGAKSPG